MGGPSAPFLWSPGKGERCGHGWGTPSSFWHPHPMCPLPSLQLLQLREEPGPRAGLSESSWMRLWSHWLPQVQRVSNMLCPPDNKATWTQRMANLPRSLVGVQGPHSHPLGQVQPGKAAWGKSTLQGPKGNHAPFSTTRCPSDVCLYQVRHFCPNRQQALLLPELNALLQKQWLFSRCPSEESSFSLA